MIERIISSAIAAIFLVFGILVFAKRPNAPANRFFAVAYLWTVVWILSNFWESEPVPHVVAEFLLHLDFASAVFIITYFLLFSLNFPAPASYSTVVKRWFLIPMLGLAFISFSDLVVRDIGTYHPGFQLLFKQGFLFNLYSIYIVGCLLATYVFLWQRWRTSKGIDKNRIAYVFFGIASATFIAVIINLCISRLFPLPTSISRVGIYGVLLLGGSVAIAIVKYQLMDIRMAIRRGVLFAFVYIFVLGIPFFMVRWMRHELGPDSRMFWWIPLIMMAVLASGGPFIYLWLRARAERKIIEERYKRLEALKVASGYMVRMTELKTLLQAITHRVVKILKLTHASVYLYDWKTEKFHLRSSWGTEQEFLRGLSEAVDGGSLVVQLLRDEKFSHRREPLERDAIMHRLTQWGLEEKAIPLPKRQSA